MFFRLGMHKIHFEVTEAVAVGEDAGPQRSAWVAAVIDGNLVGLAGMPVDIYSLLGSRGLSVGICVLTCSCGVAGCAGFHEDVVQSWGPDEVEWAFSAEDYQKVLPFLHPSADSPGNLVLKFSTKELEAALDNLTEALTKLLLVGPVEGVSKSPAKFLSSLTECRERTEELLARDKREQKSFGELWGTTLVACFPQGSVLECSGSQLLKHILCEQADAEGLTLYAEVDDWLVEQLESVWRPSIAQSPEAFLKKVAACRWDDISIYWSGVAGPKRPSGLLWAKAKLSLQYPAEE